MIDVHKMKEMSIAAIKSEVDTLPLDCPRKDILAALAADPRQGVVAIGRTLNRRYEKYQKELTHFEEMTAIENAIRDDGYKRICGIDEVGRGPLAGPVVTAAVVLPINAGILGIDDSKKLSLKRRQELDAAIRASGATLAIGSESAETIDDLGILTATKQAMIKALGGLSEEPDFVLVDAVNLDLTIPTESVIHGDALCISIAAASIVAKVYRDNLMVEYAKQYPEYGFERNMGYGTREHIAAIKKYGICPLHRRSFVNNFI